MQVLEDAFWQILRAPSDFISASKPAAYIIWISYCSQGKPRQGQFLKCLNLRSPIMMPNYSIIWGSDWTIWRLKEQVFYEINNLRNINM